MSIFELNDYRDLIRLKIEAAPNGGRGELSRIANHLAIQPSILSQVLNGTKDLTFDQAYGICDYFRLSELESDFFIALIHSQRAGTLVAKDRCTTNLEKVRKKAMQLKERVSSSTQLSDSDINQYYTYWFYTACELAADLPHLNDALSISKYLNLPLELVRTVLEFLISKGLVKDVNGKLSLGVNAIHLGADHPLVSRHHINWRTKGFEKMILQDPSDLYFTSPVTISQEDFRKFKLTLADLIESFAEKVDPSKPQTLACLNIDWFKL